jgi:hypothetical protein
MTERDKKGRWPRRLSRLALALSVCGVAVAAIAAVGTGTGLWSYGAGLGALRYALPAAVAGGLLAIVAWIIGRRQRVRTGWLNALALVTALLFAGYLGNMIITARSLPAIHDVATNLDELPQFSRLGVRADNLDKIPDQGRAELKALAPEERWKALHRQAYGDLQPLRLAAPPVQVLQRAEQLARERGWAVAGSDRDDPVLPLQGRRRGPRPPRSRAAGRVGRRHAFDQPGGGQRYRRQRQAGPSLSCRP